MEGPLYPKISNIKISVRGVDKLLAALYTNKDTISQLQNTALIQNITDNQHQDTISQLQNTALIQNITDNQHQDTISQLQNTALIQNITDNQHQDTISQLQNTALIQNITDNQHQDTISRLQTTLQAQTLINNQLRQLQANRGSAVFTRWGRRDCPANITSFVYTGYAGGSLYTDTGAAAEYLCMPSDPIWGPHKDLVYDGPWVGYVYGAEYEDAGVGVFGMMDSMHDVPCVVCVVNQFTSSLMFPGRTQCYPGWAEAYHGDLSSGAHSAAAATQYVCVDQHPQALEGGGNKDENRKLFYGVKSKCGPLHCPPYEDNNYLSCVVCLK
ncbi:uncharacterized protein LOC110463615 [Mizuhopecten yessoensis]|uniref:uncharacterized protein LOC110463615 n=1 Tax=Mizuhopecten yessoensis TaxID=6573 RepID=UPI000B45D233|nr:uncharacterized protein LOC110463615 [Mizuhopecten yessoensis]